MKARTLMAVAVTACLLLAGCSPSLDAVKESAFEEVDQMSGLDPYYADMARLNIIDAGDKASVEYVLNEARKGNTKGHERAATKLRLEKEREAKEEADRLAAEAEAAAAKAAAEQAEADLRAQWEPFFDRTLVLTEIEMGAGQLYDYGDTMIVRSDGTLEYSGRLADLMKASRWELDTANNQIQPCKSYCSFFGYKVGEDGTVIGDGLVFTLEN